MTTFSLQTQIWIFERILLIILTKINRNIVFIQSISENFIYLFVYLLGFIQQYLDLQLYFPLMHYQVLRKKVAQKIKHFCR